MNAPPRGAWLCAGISRNGGPLEETEHVVWLQADDQYADSRGFAGRTTYDGAQVRFHHEVGEPGEDVGTLERAGERLIETGTNPDGSTFLEVWTPLADDDGPAGSWRTATAQVVRVGSHLVYVDEAGGHYLTMAPGT